MNPYPKFYRGQKVRVTSGEFRNSTGLVIDAKITPRLLFSSYVNYYVRITLHWDDEVHHYEWVSERDIAEEDPGFNVSAALYPAFVCGTKVVVKGGFYSGFVGYIVAASPGSQSYLVRFMDIIPGILDGPTDSWVPLDFIEPYQWGGINEIC